MADFTDIRERIDEDIVTNGQGLITAIVMNRILNLMLDSIGELLDNKVNAEQGKGLSSNDFTNLLKAKLNNMPDITGYDANTDRITIGGKVYQLTPYVPIPDYFVGWMTGDGAASLDAFAALDANALASNAQSYNKASQASVTKTVTSSEAVGNRQVFYLMWRDGFAPVSGSVTSGGITDSLSASDFTNPSVFNAQHANVTIGEATYHVAGMRGAFDENDVFVINF